MKRPGKGPVSGKEIMKFKIAVTSGCCLDCSHCFIDRTVKRTIPFASAMKAVGIFLRSPGEVKTLEIYGGEPLTVFPLVKKIITGAQSLARRLGKRLAVSVASNGVLAGAAELDWLAARGCRFAVSFSGSELSHDLSRRFASGKGSHSLVAGKVPLFISKLKEDLHVILCVHPRRAAAAHEDFLRLEAMGFRNIGIECVHGFPWRPADLSAFGRAMRRITAHVLKRAASKNPVVLEPLLEFIREKEYRNSFCPFLRDLELFPDGTLSFYPYPFLRGKAQLKAAKMGTARGWVDRKYRDCLPEAGSRRCAECARSYYRLPGLSGGSRAHALRTAACRSAALEIVRRAAAEPGMRSYLRRLVKLFRKGYI
ncbi:MAG: hypothetical protein RDU13_03850 [Elusimicrobiales bacterium]|nr:hypothetical protein [Elusimicrobiales bacterium]